MRGTKEKIGPTGIIQIRIISQHIFRLSKGLGRSVRLLFLQAHWETDCFFAASGVQLAHSTSGLFDFRRAAVSAQLKSRVGNILTKAAALRVNLNLDESSL
jgi:hypothetical protein